MSAPELFVGITAWDSAAFLDACLDSLRRTMEGIDCRVCVIDNESEDDTAGTARRHGAEVVVARCSQADALNRLAEMSNSPRTLLMHSDVVFVADDWFPRCAAKLCGDVALVSPEDIGCGDFTRPWGAGMPESSFLLFNTATLRRLKRTFWRRCWRVPIPGRRIDFYGDHVTYRLPADLRERGRKAFLMDVHVSSEAEFAWFEPAGSFKYWRPLWGRLRYGLGNFYSIDGALTHYHNWFDRLHTLSRSGELNPLESHPPEGGVPVAFIADYSRRFLADYAAGRVELPEVQAP